MKRGFKRITMRGGPILVGGELVARLPANLRRGRAFVLADRALLRRGRELVASLREYYEDVKLIPLEAGENLKSFEGILPLYTKLSELGADRRSVLFALGGGSVGDAVGFVAGTYLRGVRWVGVPTTLLAQVDSAIGGKTGVNLGASGKNLVGLFHQPSAVLCDVGYLKSLPKRELVSGYGEILKYGLILDPKFFDWAIKNQSALLAGDEAALTHAVAKCAAMKARIVEQDERDEHGIREVLNFGHTLGHALEAAAGYGTYRHGEAVLLGMRGALRLSELRGYLSAGVANELIALLAGVSVPPIPKALRIQSLLQLMARDKKNRDGGKRFVLLRGIGKTVSDSAVSEAQLRQVLRELREDRRL
jgi:3-dehydroquinate synthase